MHITKIRELRSALNDIAARHKIEVLQMSDPKNSRVLFGNGTAAYVERSAAAGRMVFVGLYDTPEMELLGWAHEYGHVLAPRRHNTTIMLNEVDAWLWAIDFFNLHDARFTFAEVMYALESLRTYERHEPDVEPIVVPTHVVQELLALTDETDPALATIKAVIDATLAADQAKLADAAERDAFADTLLKTIVQRMKL